LSTCWSAKSSMGVNPQGRSTEKVKLLLNGTPFEPQTVRPQRHREDDDLELQKHRFTRNTKPLFLTCQMSKCFTTLPTELLQEQSTEVRCWKG
jgi:hypothetical protein